MSAPARASHHNSCLCSPHTDPALDTVLPVEMLDYNEEARKLFASLDGSKRSRFNNLDPIYRSEAGGFIYVGGDLVILL